MLGSYVRRGVQGWITRTNAHRHKLGVTKFNKNYPSISLQYTNVRNRLTVSGFPEHYVVAFVDRRKE
jgi:hypothetical protein